MITDDDLVVAQGELVYVNYGTNLNFEELERMNISLKGKIALIRYGKNFRGDKVGHFVEIWFVILFLDNLN